MDGLIIKFSLWAAICMVLSISIGIGIPEDSESISFNGYPIPFFYSGPESQIVTSGETVVMSCCIGKDNFQYGLYWLQDNVFLHVQDARNPKYWVSPEGSLMGNYSLEIDNVTADNAGDYKCVLVNGTGDLWENNLHIIRRSPVASLVVLEPEITSTSSTSQPQLQTQPSPVVPFFEVALMPVSTTEKPKTLSESESTHRLSVLEALPSQSPKESTPEPEPKEAFDPFLENEYELDSKGSIEIIPTLGSESELKPKNDKGEPGNPPVLEIASDDGGRDSQLPYYILAGMAAAVLALAIIETAILCEWGNCKFCPWKHSDPEQSCTSPNFMEAPDGGRKESRTESGANEV